MGGITASGWSCNQLPYLVEFDNFGISRNPGKANKSTENYSKGSGLELTIRELWSESEE